VLLAGDAAHLNNPLGAFGLNGGIHDAINLAEKLAAVCRGEADESLLDRYVRQRRTVNVDYVQEGSIRNLRTLAEREPAARAARFDELRRANADPAAARAFLLQSSMIASVRRAAAIA
jgi:3-(3-hydroxy-phenyl)propionate hydroxylase